MVHPIRTLPSLASLQAALKTQRQYSRNLASELSQLFENSHTLPAHQLQRNQDPEYWTALYTDLLENYASLSGSSVSRAYLLACLSSPKIPVT
jgi:hypothetical protein